MVTDCSEKLTIGCVCDVEKWICISTQGLDLEYDAEDRSAFEG